MKIPCLIGRRLPCWVVVLLSAFLSITLFLQGCSNDHSRSQEIKLTERLISKDAFLQGKDGDSLRFAIGAMITPDETLVSYKKILDYISERLGLRYELVLRDTYAQVNELVTDRAVDVAFICSGAYVNIAEESDIELIAAPIVNGSMHYHSYIIVHNNSGIQEFDDLKGKTFAFVDPMSNTGRYYPLTLLIELQTEPFLFFSNHSYTHSHSSSIEMVAAGDVDGAAVDSLVYDYMIGKDPEIEKQIRIIDKSPPFATPPFIASANLGQDAMENIKELLLGMHESPEGRAILSELGIERFGSAEDEDYDSIREMLDLISNSRL